MDKSKLIELLDPFRNSKPRITVLTGAGISAESGIPTFRGPEGYWTVGSREYHPQEMATFSMFQDSPEEVWKWYLYRMSVCSKARPNAGHHALAKLESSLEKQFTLITQNVDNLHIRAGNSLDRTYQIHGNIFFVRCAESCIDNIFPLPEGLKGKKKGEPLNSEDIDALKCPECGAWRRPHVLWFDETYDEAYYRFQSSLLAARQTDLLIIVGTSGATNLPNQVALQVLHNRKTIIDINIEENPFSRIAETSPGGCHIKAPSGDVLPVVSEILRDNLSV